MYLNLAYFIKDKKDRIKALFTLFPETRTNYSLLLVYYWKYFDHVDLSDEVIKQIKNATQPETITRYKRYINSAYNNQVLNQIRESIGEIIN